MTNEKTSGETPELVRQPHGGALQVGNPGNAGGGRPRNEFRRRLRELVSSEEAMAFLERCLKGEEGAQAAMQAHRYAAEGGYGKVPQQFEVSSALMGLDLNLLSDHAISRIADGEHPIKVLIGAVLGGEEDPRAVEHLREDILPRLLLAGHDEADD